jgi:Holliday junction resolvase
VDLSLTVTDIKEYIRWERPAATDADLLDKAAKAIRNAAAGNGNMAAVRDIVALLPGNGFTIEEVVAAANDVKKQRVIYKEAI